MDQLSIALTPELRLFLESGARRNERTLAGEVRYQLMQAMLRSGMPTANLAPWPPPQAMAVTGENLAEARAQVAEWTVERDKLAKREGRTGAGALMPNEQDRLSWLRGQIMLAQSHINVFERGKGVRS